MKINFYPDSDDLWRIIPPMQTERETLVKIEKIDSDAARISVIENTVTSDVARWKTLEKSASNNELDGTLGVTMLGGAAIGVVLYALTEAINLLNNQDLESMTDHGVKGFLALGAAVGLGALAKRYNNKRKSGELSSKGIKGAKNTLDDDRLYLMNSKGKRIDPQNIKLL